MSAPDFWDDQARAQKVIAQRSAAHARVESWETVHKSWEELSVLVELAEDDDELAAEAAALLPDVQRALESLELMSLLSGEHDEANAILTIHPGAGGTEAQDWAQMLYRMYVRWADDHDYNVQVLDELAGDEAGIKSVTLLIAGRHAYGYLKSEAGVHRLVRISPFDASGRRHTSFASVEVLPEVEEGEGITIDPTELRIDTYRSSGAGGQHVNKTESAIRITHVPTGIVVQCQSERSQHSNRDSALKILQAKLLERQEREQRAKLDELRGDQEEIAWGSQIRSYVFCPYTMVKDHRTNEETANVDAVMDGRLDAFIEAFLRKRGAARAGR